MKKLKYIGLTFDLGINSEEIRAFRYAFSKEIQEGAEYFHHHLEDGSKRFRYPLAQFNTKDEKAHLVCLEEASDCLLSHIGNPPLYIDFHGKRRELNIENMYLKPIVIQVWDEQVRYRLKNWLPLNSKNYEMYFKTYSLKARVEMLERILVAHIINFAEGIRYTLESPIKAVIEDIRKERWINYKGIKLYNLDIDFSVNMTLPIDVNIGKLASIGYGTVQKAVIKEPITKVH